MSTKEKAKSKPRTYRKITDKDLIEFERLKLLHGNNTATVRAMYKDEVNPSSRGFHLARKLKQQSASEYIEKGLQQMAEPALKRVGEMVNSGDERIATRNAHFVIDHVRGKAVQRTESKNVNLNIQTVLD